MNFFIRAAGVREPIPFEYGDLQALYPEESYDEIKARRQSNWEILKSVCDLNKLNGRPVYIANERVEFYRPSTETITISDEEILKLTGLGSRTEMVFYPFTMRLEASNHYIFKVDYGSVIHVSNILAKTAKKQGKLETYNCVLKKGGDAKVIEITDPVRDGFWDELEVGDGAFYSWQINVLAGQNTIASWDEGSSTITLSNNISALVASDTPALFGRHFGEDISENDYDLYGEFWRWNGVQNIRGAAFIHSIPTDHSGKEVLFSFNRMNVENFERGIDISAGNFQVRYNDLVFTDCAVGFSAFARGQLNSQSIVGTNLSFIRCGFDQVAQVDQVENGNFGSGSYFHPTVIFKEYGTLYLKDNFTSGFRQFSSSIEVVMEGVSSYYKKVFAEGGQEYDVYTSNCMPVTIDEFIGDNLRIGGTLTVNNGIINLTASSSSLSEPPNGTPVEWIFNNVEFYGKTTTQYNALTEAVHDLIFNDCIFWAKESTQLDSFVQVAGDTRKLEFNNCSLRKDPDANIPTWTPGVAVPAGAFACALINAIGKEIIINNIETEFLKGTFIAHVTNAVTPSVSPNGNRIIINNSDINYSRIIFQQYVSEINILYITDQIGGENVKVPSPGYAGLGALQPMNFKLGNGTKKDATIITSNKTYVNNGGGTYVPFNSFNIAGVLEIDWEHKTYYVNTGEIKRIVLPSWVGASLAASEILINDSITIHAVGGDVVLHKWDSAANEYGNILDDIIIPAGTSISITHNNKHILSKSANELVERTFATADGTKKYYQGYVSTTERLVVPESFVIKIGEVIGTADANGVISGEGIDNNKSFIDYWTGAFWITLIENVANGVDIDIEYEKYVDWRVTGAWSLVE